MSFYRECKGCGQNSDNVRCVRGERGPIGPRGEQGPQGIDGPPNYDKMANFYNLEAYAITIGGAITFSEVYNFDTDDIVLAQNSDTITLAAGFYQITYITSAQSPVSTGVLGTVLTINGVILQNSISVTTELNVGNSETIGATFIVEIPEGGANIQLINGTEVTTTFNHINLIIKKLNVQP